MRAIKYTTATWAKRVTVMMLMLMLMMTTTIRGIIEARAPSRPPRRSWRRCRWTWGRRQSPAVGCRRSTWACAAAPPAKQSRENRILQRYTKKIITFYFT
eukprot:9479052-Pyramimonas_sp.AAC.1